MVWRKLLRLLDRAQAPKVVISGLKHEHKSFSESIREEAQAFLGKAGKVLDGIEGITVHVKSSGRGDAAKFELHSLLSSSEASFHASASGFKLNLVLKDLFDELLKEARKHKGIRDERKKHAEKRFYSEVDVE